MDYLDAQFCTGGEDELKETVTRSVQSFCGTPPPFFATFKRRRTLCRRYF